MARTVTRPKITVQAVYMGDMDMREVFISLLVSEVRQSKNSVRIFENVNNTEYNGDITEIKEAG